MFEWDKNKDRQNKKKHGISFSDTFAVFEDAGALTIEDESHEEERFVTIGMDCYGRVLVVIYAWRDENIRIISARKAMKPEVRQYESEL